jgi:hypothetical protein
MRSLLEIGLLSAARSYSWLAEVKKPDALSEYSKASGELEQVAM